MRHPRYQTPNHGQLLDLLGYADAEIREIMRQVQEPPPEEDGRKDLAKDHLLPKETRFDSSVVMVCRSRDLKMPLREAVVDEAFELHLNDPSVNLSTPFSMTHRGRATPGSRLNFPSMFTLLPAMSRCSPTVPNPRELL